MKGRIIAPKMGKKMGSSSTFIMSFSARGDRLEDPTKSTVYRDRSQFFIFGQDSYFG